MEVDAISIEERLRQACEEAQAVEAAELIRQGADVRQAGAEGRTPVLLACRAGRLDLVRLLLEAGGRADETDDEGYGAALLAAESGNTELLAWLVSEGWATLEERSEDGSTVLLGAASSGDVEMLRWLLDEQLARCEGTSISLADLDDRGADCFLAAAENGSVQMLKELLRRGQSATVVDAHGCGVLHYAAAGGHVAVVDYCVKQLKVLVAVRDGDGDTPLIVAAHEGNVDAIERLLQLKANPADTNATGVSALLAAAAGDSSEAVECLTRRCGGEDAWPQEIARHPQLVLGLIESGAPHEVPDTDMLD